MHKNNFETQKGQALLFVVVAMTIAMAIGINASIRTISSVSRTTRTDTSTRALAAAEGGIERFLARSIAELEDVVEGNGCPIGEEIIEPYSCKLIFEGSGDSVISEAYVSVSRYIPDHYPFDLDNGQIKEVNLYDMTNDTFYSEDNIEICWSPSDPSPGSNITFLSYNETGIKAHGGLEGDGSATGTYEGFIEVGVGNSDYDFCHTVDIDNDIYGLRIRSLGGNSSIAVYATGGADLPMQGYQIVSIGRLQQDSGVTASRTIKVVRTLPYLPGAFDYALYSQSSIGN